MKLTRIILYFLTGVWIAQFAFYFGSLPEIMASHFNAAGEADGWTGKNVFVIFELMFLLLIVGEFTVLPLLFEKIPDSLINLPNKTYWLANERRAATLNVIKTSFEWFAVILLTLYIAVNQLLFRANTQQRELSSTAILIVLGFFFAAMIFWMWKYLSYFRKI